MIAKQLSATGRKWVATMGRVYTADRLQPIIDRAAHLANLRGGRSITRDDLNEALDLIAKQELAQAIVNRVWD